MAKQKLDFVNCPNEDPIHLTMSPETRVTRQSRTYRALKQMTSFEMYNRSGQKHTFQDPPFPRK